MTEKQGPPKGAGDAGNDARKTAKEDLLEWCRAQGMGDLQMLYIETCPPGAAFNYLRALMGGSPTSGIKHQCLACCGYSREGVRRCIMTACSLYPYRPYK